MKKIIKKCGALLFALSIFLQSTMVSYAGFSDVPGSSPYLQDIQFLQDNKIFEGTVFGPDESTTRAAFAEWLLRSAGYTAKSYQPKTTARFDDISPTDTHGYAVYRLVDLGLFQLKKKRGQHFNPELVITKKDALQWTFFVDGIPVPQLIDETKFKASDVKADSKMAPLIDKAINLGVVAAGEVNPYKVITHAEAAHILHATKNTAPIITVTIVPAATSDLQTNSKFNLMLEAWNAINKTYLHRDQVNPNALVFGAIEGMVKELGDKHSEFVRPGDNALIDTLSGRVEGGIGAVLQLENNQIIVVAPVKDSPAEKAGLQSNDIITAVDDKDIKGMTLNSVVSLIKGQNGTQVKITVLRGVQTLSFTITRDVIKIVSASLSRTNDNIGIITINVFGQNTAAEFRTVIEQLKANKPRAIVLDLRNNPGGYLDTAVLIAGYFIKSGDRVANVKYPDKEEHHDSTGTAELGAYKMVVILNGGSASASEILAGALQDYGIAKIVGEKSYGKGTVQELSSYADGSSLKLTVAEWLTPKGRSIEKNGITPDIEVKITDADRAAKKDPQLDAALQNLR